MLVLGTLNYISAGAGQIQTKYSKVVFKLCKPMQESVKIKLLMEPLKVPMKKQKVQ